jgi:hypothetical protein
MLAFPRLLLIPLAACAAVLLATAGLLLATEKRATPVAPNFGVVKVGGVQYQAVDARPVNPANSVDRRIVAGLPARYRRTPHSTLLFGAFISATDASGHPLRTAGRIDLRDDSGRVYRPLPLPPSNEYAYAQRTLRANVSMPAQDTPAAETLAAGGRMLLFKIPAWRYDNGSAFELLIHHAHGTTSLII